MKLYLDTSTDIVKLRLDDKEYEWQPERGRMAEGIFRFVRDKLQENSANWLHLTEITYYSGPGSFTGLRIGAALVNTLVDHLQIPLYDHHGNRLQLILPDYGRSANISKPRK